MICITIFNHYTQPKLSIMISYNDVYVRSCHMDERERELASKKYIILGSVFCLVASMSWGAMFPVAHTALQIIDPFYFNLIRYCSVTIILLALLWYKEGRKSFRLDGKFKQLLLYGTMGFTVYNFLIFIGQKMMGEAGTIAASITEVLMPMITVVFLWITMKNKPAKFTMISIVLALAGAMLVITKGQLSFFVTAQSHLFPLLLFSLQWLAG